MLHRMQYGSNHPSSQLSACSCGSGQPLVACCDAGHADEPCECGSGKLFGVCCRVDLDMAPDDWCPCGSGLTPAECCAPHVQASVAD